MKPAFLGIDLGTSSVKALIVDLDGRVLGQGACPHHTDYPQPGHAEQDPAVWWDGVGVAVRSAYAASGQPPLAAIGLSGQMHGTVLVDDAFRPVAPAVTWADTRSSDQVRMMTNDIGADRLIEIAGSPLAPGFQAATVRWIKEMRPDLWNTVRTIFLPKDFLRCKMTGAAATEPSDASSTLLFDVTKRDWSSVLLDAAGVRREQLPSVLESNSVSGYLNEESAVHLGLSPGIPVVAGGGDAPLAALGSGVVDSRSLLLTISTGSQVVVPTDRPLIDRTGKSHTWCTCVNPDQGLAPWYRMGATLASGLALRWLRENVFGLKPDAPYEHLIESAAGIPPGSQGLVFLPYLIGERTPLMDSSAAGMFLGLTIDHDRRHLTRAVIEGSVMALHHAFEHVMGDRQTPDRVVLAGGGVRGLLWRQVVADIFNLPIVPLETIEGSATGAAMLAASGVNEITLEDAAANWPSYRRQVLPNPEANAVYQTIEPIFREAYAQNRESLHRLVELAHRGA